MLRMTDEKSLMNEHASLDTQTSGDDNTYYDCGRQLESAVSLR